MVWETRRVVCGGLACMALLALTWHYTSTHDTSAADFAKRVIGGMSTDLKIGTGIYDVTGPAAEINMMGYAHMGQNTAGIHIRTRARAFVFEGGAKRAAFVSVDSGMASQMVTTKALEALEKLVPSRYSKENVCISGTHTHSAPAGFLQYTLYQITSLGYNEQTTTAFANGIAHAIALADANLREGRVSLTQGLLADASINRSPSAYVLNPAEERARYEKVGNNTDHNMVLLRLDTLEGNPIGMVNWFAVHATSMNNTNTLISGDNKGVASLLFERKYNAPGTLPGKGSVVGAFANSNLGDVSPNTRGPHCLDTGLPCDTITSTCNGKNELCVASGPGKDMVESTYIIGEKQYQKAVELFEATERQEITGPVDFRHQFINMPSQTTSDGHPLCSPAMGYSFAAGTTDGPGAFDFKQSTTSPNPFWNIVSHILAKPSQATMDCHAPKPILLDTGDVSFPYAWQPSIVPIQIIRVGQLVILGVPGEFTTMAGRRLREAVKSTLVSKGVLRSDEGQVVIAGLSNTYSSYITTFEEYQQQRYEGASTIFGPHTLQAYIERFVALASALADGKAVDPGPTPPDSSAEQYALQPGVIVDSVSSGHEFGTVTTQPISPSKVGSTVWAEFRSGNPRNNLRTEGTFMTVERQEESGDWTVVATDGDWETRYQWYRHHTISAESFAKVSWTIPAGTAPGTYRLRHYGDHKNLFGGVHSFEGASNPFQVEA